MSFALSPRAGEIFGHVLENKSINLDRNLFWNITVDLDPVEWGGESRDCALAVEWLIWPVRRWRHLDGASLGNLLRPGLVQCSVH
ncbi:MAG: hypothetical protein WDN24_06615 [Sphingomonas sp.]